MDLGTSFFGGLGSNPTFVGACRIEIFATHRGCGKFVRLFDLSRAQLSCGFGEMIERPNTLI